MNNDAEDAEYQYAEVNVANPWKAGTLLHRYILIPKGKEGDEMVARLALQRTSGMGCTTDTVRTPVERSAVFIAPHCQLMYELGCQQAIRGVCDLDYINIPDVKKRATSAGNAAAGKLLQEMFLPEMFLQRMLLPEIPSWIAVRAWRPTSSASSP